MERDAVSSQNNKERLSKACFYKPPQKVSASKSGNNSEKPELGGFYQNIPFETDQTIQLRYSVYKQNLRKVRAVVRQCVLDLDMRTFQSIQQFVKRVGISTPTTNTETSSSIDLPIEEIPTILLATGTSVQDHQLTFTLLSDYLIDNVTPHVVSLCGKDNANAASLKRNFLEQLFQDSEDHVALIKRSKINFNFLKKWYSSTYGKNESKPGIILIFEDLQSFSVDALETIILQFSDLQPKFPITFLFGLPLIQGSMNRFSRETLALLATEKFQLNAPENYLNAIVTNLCITPEHRFFIDHTPLKVLLDQFLFHDLSYASFVQSYEYIMLDFFMDAPASIFLGFKDDESDFDRDFDFNKLDSQYYDLLRGFNSFRKHVESLEDDPQRQIDLLTKDRIMYEFVTKCLKEIDAFHTKRSVILRCFSDTKLAILNDDPDHNDVNISRKTCSSMVRDVLCESLGKVVVEGNDYQKLVSNFRKLDIETLMKLTAKYVLHLENLGSTADSNTDADTDLIDLKDELQTLLQRLEYLFENDLEHVEDIENRLTANGKASLEQTTNTNDGNEGSESDSDNAQECNVTEHIITTRRATKGQNSLRAVDALTSVDTSNWSKSKKNRLSKLRTLTEMAVHSNLPANLRIRTNLQVVRDDVISKVHGVFERYLRPITLPLHELCYASSISNWRKRMTGSPRTHVQIALSYPERYMKLDSHNTFIRPGKKRKLAERYDIPHACVIYELYQECGRLINLYDLFRAFTAKVSPALDIEKPGKERDELHVQMIRVVSELLFMGFVKNTKRKTDHVERLTWGSL